jgi:hypothetical protein
MSRPIEVQTAARLLVKRTETSPNVKQSRAGDPEAATEVAVVVAMMKNGTALMIGTVTGVRCRPRIRRATVSRLDLRLVVVSTTTFALLVYVICIALGLLFPASVMWVASVPGFRWTVGGIVLGLVEIGSYAALGSAAYVWLYNMYATWLAWPPRRA